MWKIFKKLFGLDTETEAIGLDKVTEDDLMQTLDNKTASGCSKTKCDGQVNCSVDTAGADPDIDVKSEAEANTEGECKAQKQHRVLSKPGSRKYHSETHGGGAKNHKRQPRKKD